MTRPLLPQEPAPVTPQQAALTARFLLPAQDALMALFRDIRAATDRELEPRLPPRNGKPYPYGRCHEITMDVVARLRERLKRPDHDGIRAMAAFLRAGGTARPIWGALRGQYLQNALQFGGLYIDASNDTVTVTKPKVEILPLADAGFEALRGPEHFADVAGRYWQARFYANHIVPSLAPMLPLIAVREGLRPQLQSATDYMIDLLSHDGFRASEGWLADGPPPPPAVAAALNAHCPSDLRAADPRTAREAALDACRNARNAGHATDVGWRDARVADYLRLTAFQPVPAPVRILAPPP